MNFKLPCTIILLWLLLEKFWQNTFMFLRLNLLVVMALNGSIPPEEINVTVVSDESDITVRHVSDPSDFGAGIDRHSFEDLVDSGMDNEPLKRSADNLSDEETIDFKKQKWNKLWEPIEIPPDLSKRQRKKYIRKVLWETKWKPLRRMREKAKLKEKKLQARMNNESLGPSRKMLKQCTMASSSCKLRIALDFSFDDLMSDKDLGKCLKQLNHCYCLNRRAANPLQFYVTNFSGTAKQQMAKVTGYQNWDVHFLEENHLNVFSKEELVYLTSDSENIVSTLDDDKVYVIGALVDHNQHKGKTLGIAIKQGISHGQLPIGDYLEMNSRKVLTIDHVFNILIHKSEGVSWKEAFLRVIPQRKKAVEKTPLESYNNHKLQDVTDFS